MDVKFIILLLLLVLVVGLVFMSMREIDSTRSEVEKSISDLSTNVDEKFKNLRQKQSADNGALIAKLKKENADLVEQVRKMNLLNNQTLTNKNEFMTVETSDTSSHNMIPYLSDDRHNKLVGRISTVGTDSKNKSPVKLTAKSVKRSSQQENNSSTSSVFLSKSGDVVNLSHTSESPSGEDNEGKDVQNELNKMNDNNLDWTVKDGNGNVLVNSYNDEDGDNNETDDNEKVNDNAKNTLNELAHQDETKENDNSENEGEKDNDSNEDSNEDSNSEEESVSESADDNANVDNESEESVKIEVEFIGADKLPKTTDKTLQNMIDLETVNKKLDNLVMSDETVETDSSKDEQDNENESNEEDNSAESKSQDMVHMMDSITLGSSKKKKGANTQISLKKKVADTKKKADTDSPTASDESSNIISDSEDTLDSNGNIRPIDQYTVKELRDLAKKNMIPVLSKADNSGKKRFLKKTELYSKIKKVLK
jgi:hypothetical protein